MPRSLIGDLDDPRLDRFRDLRQRNPTRYGHYFIAEGRLVVERLLANAKYHTQAVVVEEQREAIIADHLREDHDVYVLATGLFEQLVGFDFHRGVMACGTRPKLPDVKQLRADPTGRDVYVVAHEVQDPTNLGNMIRTAVGLGAKGMILGRATADPWARRVLRVSMGTVLELEFYESRDLEQDLRWLWEEQRVASVAATLGADSIPLTEFRHPGPVAAVFGNEGVGLPGSIEAACTYRATIPMSERADSLNVSVATGIFLYELTNASQIHRQR